MSSHLVSASTWAANAVHVGKIAAPMACYVMIGAAVYSLSLKGSIFNVHVLEEA